MLIISLLEIAPESKHVCVVIEDLLEFRAETRVLVDAIGFRATACSPSGVEHT